MNIIIFILLLPIALTLDLGDIFGDLSHGGDPHPGKPSRPPVSDRPPRSRRTEPPQETQPPQQTLPAEPPRKPRPSRSPRPTGRPLPSKKPRTRPPVTRPPPRTCDLFCKDGHRVCLGSPECVPNCPADSCDSLKCNGCEQCVMVNEPGCYGLDCEQHPKCIPFELKTCESEGGTPPCGCDQTCRMVDDCFDTCDCYPKPVCYPEHPVSFTSQPPTEEPRITTYIPDYG